MVPSHVAPGAESPRGIAPTRTDRRAVFPVVKYLSLIAVAALFSVPSSVLALSQGADSSLTMSPVDDGRGTPFIVNKSDNICGLDEPRQLTKPAVVDYGALLAATPELKKIKKDKIDPASSEGITLTMKGRARVLKACESIRQSGSHCSVWKAIKRRNKKAIPDITAAVKRLL